MLMGDLVTLTKYKLPVKIIIFNNGKLRLIKVEQEVEGYPESQTGLNNPEFITGKSSWNDRLSCKESKRT